MPEVISHELDVPRWPEDKEGFALDILKGNRPEKAGIEGVSSVVPHHEEFTLGDRYWPEGASVWGLVINIWLLFSFPVHEEHTVLNRDFVSWQPYNALYQILLATLGATLNALEDHDVVPLGLVEAVDELIDEQAVTYLKGRYHALRGDVEGLDDEWAYEAEDEHKGDDEN